ncbi:MAG TPA: hypothetical protein VF183_12015 [Acidimicrobiales bacterium]
MFEHERLGAIAYEWPRYWPALLEASRQARDDLAALHDRIGRVPPGRDGSRTLFYDFIEPAIAAHGHMILDAVLTTRYFVLELERVAQLQPAAVHDDLRRLRAACIGAGLDDPAQDERWPLLGELVGVRHRIEHPTQGTIYSADAWDRVPLAWSLTGRALECFDAFHSCFCDLANAWEARRTALARRGVFDVVQRGLRSRRPPKKPPPS